MAETVLVTGGTGYIAGWCIAQLLQQGYGVRTTMRSLSKEVGVRAAIASAGADTSALSFLPADLTSDSGWDAAMAGADYVLHVASPLGGAATADRDAYVTPARDGTLRVLRAAVKAGVKRVVMTSAAAAARAPIKSRRASDETVWSDPDDPQFDAYRRSKVLAERAAWDFMKAEGGKTEFTTVLPGAVFGPVLSKDNIGSVGIILGLMNGRPPAAPRIGFWVVDVRDLADLHIRAMKTQGAAGERFLATGEFIWMPEVGKTLHARLGARAANATVRALPDVVVRAMMPFTPQLRGFAAVLGVKVETSSAKARRVLGFAPRPATDTIVDCAESLMALTR